MSVDERIHAELRHVLLYDACVVSSLVALLRFGHGSCRSRHKLAQVCR